MNSRSHSHNATMKTTHSTTRTAQHFGSNSGHMSVDSSFNDVDEDGKQSKSRSKRKRLDPSHQNQAHKNEQDNPYVDNGNGSNTEEPAKHPSKRSKLNPLPIMTTVSGLAGAYYCPDKVGKALAIVSSMCGALQLVQDHFLANSSGPDSSAPSTSTDTSIVLSKTPVFSSSIGLHVSTRVVSTNEGPSSSLEGQSRLERQYCDNAKTNNTDTFSDPEYHGNDRSSNGDNFQRSTTSDETADQRPTSFVETIDHSTSPVAQSRLSYGNEFTSTESVNSSFSLTVDEKDAGFKTNDRIDDDKGENKMNQSGGRPSSRKKKEARRIRAEDLKKYLENYGDVVSKHPAEHDTITALIGCLEKGGTDGALIEQLGIIHKKNRSKPMNFDVSAMAESLGEKNDTTTADRKEKTKRNQNIAELESQIESLEKNLESMKELTMMGEVSSRLKTVLANLYESYFPEAVDFTDGAEDQNGSRDAETDSRTLFDIKHLDSYKKYKKGIQSPGFASPKSTKRLPKDHPARSLSSRQAKVLGLIYPLDQALLLKTKERNVQNHAVEVAKVSKVVDQLEDYLLTEIKIKNIDDKDYRWFQQQILTPALERVKADLSEKG